jgi:hypothetical protein
MNYRGKERVCEDHFRSYKCNLGLRRVERRVVFVLAYWSYGIEKKGCGWKGGVLS